MCCFLASIATILDLREKLEQSVWELYSRNVKNKNDDFDYKTPKKVEKVHPLFIKSDTWSAKISQKN